MPVTPGGIGAGLGGPELSAAGFGLLGDSEEEQHGPLRAGKGLKREESPGSPTAPARNRRHRDGTGQSPVLPGGTESGGLRHDPEPTVRGTSGTAANQRSWPHVIAAL